MRDQTSSFVREYRCKLTKRKTTFKLLFSEFSWAMNGVIDKMAYKCSVYNHLSFFLLFLWPIWHAKDE